MMRNHMNKESTVLESWMVPHLQETKEQAIKFRNNLRWCPIDQKPMEHKIMFRWNLTLPPNDLKRNKQRIN